MSIFNKKSFGLALFLFVLSLGLFVSVKTIEAQTTQNLHLGKFTCDSFPGYCYPQTENFVIDHSPGGFINFRLYESIDSYANFSEIKFNGVVGQDCSMGKDCSETYSGGGNGNWNAPLTSGCYVFPVYFSWGTHSHTFDYIYSVGGVSCGSGDGGDGVVNIDGPTSVPQNQSFTLIWSSSSNIPRWA